MGNFSQCASPNSFIYQILLQNSKYKSFYRWDIIFTLCLIFIKNYKSKSMCLELNQVETRFLNKNLVCERYDSKHLNILKHCFTLEHKHPMMTRFKAFRLVGKYSIFPWTLASIVSHRPSHAIVNQVLHSSLENLLGEALSVHDKISQDKVYTFLTEIGPRVSEVNKVHLTFLKVELHLQTFHSHMKGIRENI